uniref:Uncharacterized protein n=2 Tax=Candidatus Kentrum sp. FM TaxID=2126340 RepID=A0A450TI52_9GAMM|nr:MAG: hypothetical protein BECKFM1743A_GA0114220_104284 [Candidatus Kentron sp. FM]
MGECSGANTLVRPYAPPNVGANLVFAHYARFALRHPTGNNLPTLLAYLSQILVQLLCCNDSYIVHYAPVIAPRS